MFSPKVFFSFTEVPNSGDHRAYNAWHQLDHRPENLLLPGVLWGERWVRSPDCAAAGSGSDPALKNLHYLNMYWFRDPVDDATAEWSALAERSFHWGRRDDVHLANRLLMDFFRPIKGYVNSRVLVSADALPFRPTRGIYVTVTRVDEPRSPEAETLFRWYDRSLIPAMLECRGAAGAWTFASESTFAAPLDLSGNPSPSSTRIVIVYLDDDPLVFAEDLALCQGDAQSEAAETLLAAGPLRTITPWQWDWFDGA
ncbi:MAG TPA: hypothetical protein VGH66_03115 [Acidimicrobiales bacterium]|jgi:hypothetical protein